MLCNVDQSVITLVSMQSGALICGQAGSKCVLQLNISYIVRQQNGYDLATVGHMMCHITGILSTQFCCSFCCKSTMTLPFGFIVKL